MSLCPVHISKLLTDSTSNSTVMNFKVDDSTFNQLSIWVIISNTITSSAAVLSHCTQNCKACIQWPKKEKKAICQ